MTRNSSGCVYLAKSSSERFVGLGVSQLSLFFVFMYFLPIPEGPSLRTRLRSFS